MATQKIPVEIYQLADAKSLGKPLTIHKTDFRFYLILIPSVMSLSLVIILVSLPFVLWYRRIPQEDILMTGAITIGVFLLIEAVWASMMLVPRFSTRNHHVYVYTEGLIYKTPENSHVIYWEHVERAEGNTIYSKYNQKIELTRYFNIDRVIKSVKKHVRDYRRNASKTT